MRKHALFLSLLLGVFPLALPVHAVNYTGEAWMDWTSLRLTGIPITMRETSQLTNVVIPPNNTPEESFQDWRDHTTALNIPPVTALSHADANRVYASVSLAGPGVGSAQLYRSAVFTALETGKLTVSIDYSLQQSGVTSLPSDIESKSRAFLLLSNPSNVEALRELSSAAGDRTQSGTLSLTESFQKGEGGVFATTLGVNVAERTGTVPLPDMLWPTLAGLIGIALWVERRRRHERFG